MSTLIDRQKSMLQLRATHRRHTRSTAGALGDLLTPLLEPGEDLPDLELLQGLFLRLLELAWNRFSTADDALRDTLDRHSELVTERDVATAHLYREVVDLRRMLRGIFGTDPAAHLIGLRGTTSQDPVVLLRQADRATARLRDPGRPSPPSPRQPPVTDPALARAHWSAPVAGATGRLRLLLTAVTRAAKDLDAARLERRRALEHFNQSFIVVADWLVATYNAIGRQDRAGAVRPSRKYPGQTTRDAERRTSKRAPVESVDSAQTIPFPKLQPLFRLFGARRQSS